MSESSEEKQFAPTEQKLRKALEEGNAMFIPQINSGIILVISLIFLSLLSKVLFTLYDNSFSMLFRLSGSSISNEEIKATVTNNLFVSFASILAILFLLGMVSLAISLVQVKGLRFVPLRIRFEVFNIFETAKQKFSKKIFAKLVIELIFIVIMIYIEGSFFFNNLNELSNMIYLDINNQVSLLSYLILKLIVLAIITLLVYLILLYSIEKAFYIKNLMMSRQEMKQEIENSEGKAEVKGRIKELQQELLEDDAYMDAILNEYGSFVVTNPTHYGVVLFYAKDILPLVMLKGKNQTAKNIIAKAKALGIPIIQNRFVARMLYELTSPGEAVPKSLIKDIGKLVGMNYEAIKPFIKDKSALVKKNLS